ncbi:MAG: CinA family nicotinamide mononucleotide deamidase-related protein [Candidatus Mycalebacterium zealandia]|nr:MAG: CinA family nicotinamide mononucleotide deamidase-related protein [Candidatus Mycalebacterium zealandia]
MPGIEFISIGDEVLSGTTEDRNFSFAAGEVVAAGLSPPVRRTSVRDNKKEIKDALRRAEQSGFVIVCGGLGPTPDDLTAACAADFFGEPLKSNPEALEHVRTALKKMKRRVLASHKKQAMMPESACVIPNSKGTSAGFMCESKRAVFYFLPGVPREFQAMTTGFVVPDIQKRSGAEKHSLKAVGVFGIPESELARKVEKMKIKNADISYRIVRDYEIEVRISHASDPKIVGNAAEKIKKRLGKNVFSVSGATLAETVAQILLEKNLTVSVAESCTAGILASNLTQTAGSSKYFTGGVIPYSNRSKSDLLGVAQDVIEKKGAVSAEVARAMAAGTQKRFDSDIGVGITGIAGPGGGSFEKPVGTVYIATIAGKSVADAVCGKFQFTGSRDRVRRHSVARALYMIMEAAQPKNGVKNGKRKS